MDLLIEIPILQTASTHCLDHRLLLYCQSPKFHLAIPQHPLNRYASIPNNNKSKNTPKNDKKIPTTKIIAGILIYIKSVLDLFINNIKPRSKRLIRHNDLCAFITFCQCYSYINLRCVKVNIRQKVAVSIHQTNTAFTLDNV